MHLQLCYFVTYFVTYIAKFRIYTLNMAMSEIVILSIVLWENEYKTQYSSYRDCYFPCIIAWEGHGVHVYWDWAHVLQTSAIFSTHNSYLCAGILAQNFPIKRKLILHKDTYIWVLSSAWCTVSSLHSQHLTDFRMVWKWYLHLILT